MRCTPLKEVPEVEEEWLCAECRLKPREELVLR